MGGARRSQSLLRGRGVQKGWTLLRKETLRYFCKSINSKRRAKENLHPLTDAAGNIISKDDGKDEVLNDFFTCVFYSQAR